MLKVLIKKQFYQTFSGYFVDAKTGKAKSKSKRIGSFVLFGFLMLLLCVCFYGMALSMEVFLDTEFRWLYYATFGIITISLGTFASAFNTANTLYNSKDNNLLLSMPIKPSYILLSRVALVFGLSFIYCAVVWIPGCLFPLLRDGFNLLVVILDILLLFITTLLTSVASCVVGYVVATFSNKVKNKNIVTVIISSIFLIVYYFFCFRFSNLLEQLVSSGEQIAKSISTWGNLFYQLGKAADGNLLSFVIYTLICSALAIACYCVLSKSFYKIVTSANNVSVSNTKVTYKANNNVSKTLLKKEFKRFISSPIYMMNTSLGDLFVLGVAIVVAVKAKDFLPLLDVFKNEIPEVFNFIPLVIIGAICTMISLNASAVPSVSLEGKNLWIIKSLPVKTLDILNAKKQLQIYINLIPSAVAAIIVSIALQLESTLIIFNCVSVIMFVQVHASICTLLSLVNPNFNWTSETQPVKQNINVLLELVISLILIVVMVGTFYLFRNTLQIVDYLEAIIIVLALLEILLRRFIASWGVNKFESL